LYVSLIYSEPRELIYGLTACKNSRYERALNVVNNS